MRPRADDQAASGRDMRRRLAADGDEILQLRGQERIEPTRHQEYGRHDLARAINAVDLLPIVVVRRVREPVVEKRDVLRAAVVGLDQRPAVDATIDHLDRRHHVDRAAAVERPIEWRLERERSALMEHRAKARARDLDIERAQIVLIRNGPLRVSVGGSAPGREPAVEPRLALEPLERRDPVGALVAQRIVCSAGFVTAARSLDDRVVAARRPVMGKRAGAKLVLQSAAERNPHQDRRRFGERAWPVDVGAQHHPVRRRHGNAVLDADAMLGRPDSIKRKKDPAGHFVTGGVEPADSAEQRDQAQ